MTDKREKPSWDENALIRLQEMIADSRVFLTLFSDGYKKDPTALVQLMFAVMMEKPVYMLVPVGTHVPRGLRRLADGIEEYDPAQIESLERATARLIEKTGLEK
jgi:hypothetical protein